MSWDIRSIEGVAVVTMNSNKANVQNDAFFGDLHEAFDRLDREPPAHGVVLTAEGATFSAGIDLKFAFPLFASRDVRAVAEFFLRYRATNLRLFTYPRLTVAAVNGHAFAGGLITALCCDFRIGVRGEGRYSLNEVPIGIPMPAIYVEMIKYAVGSRNAALATLSGAVDSAGEALDLGFLDECVPPDRLLGAAIARARTVPADAAPAYAYSKRGLQAATLADVEALANAQDEAHFATAVTDPANLRAQRAKFHELTGAPLDT